MDTTATLDEKREDCVFKKFRCRFRAPREEVIKDEDKSVQEVGESVYRLLATLRVINKSAD
jgi:hypothetical protein